MMAKLVLTSVIKNPEEKVLLVISNDENAEDIEAVVSGVNTFDDVFRYSTDLDLGRSYFISFYSPTENTIQKWGTVSSHQKVAQSYSFAVGCCSASTYPTDLPLIFNQIVESGPSFLVHLGDYAYSDIPSNDVKTRIDSTFKVNMRDSFGPISKAMPLYLTYDNHDYGVDHDDKMVDKFAPSASAAMAALRYIYPHYGLEDDRLIGQGFFKFFTNRVMHIVTDQRSARDPISVHLDDPEKTAWGAKQKEWVFKNIERAKRDKQIVFLYLPSEWNYTIGSNVDNMNDFRQERRDICDFIASLGMAKQVFIMSGDAHQAAYDDGSNGDFSTLGNCPVASVSVGALNSGHIPQSVALRAEQYSYGVFSECNSYIYDYGNNIISKIHGPYGRTRNVTFVDIDEISSDVVNVTIKLMCQAVNNDPLDDHYVPDGEGLKLKKTFTHEVTMAQ